MNAYRIIALVAVLLLLTYVFDLHEAVRALFLYLAAALGTLATRLANAPLLAVRGPNREIVDLALVLALLIALVGIVKLFLTRKGKNESDE